MFCGRGQRIQGRRCGAQAASGGENGGHGWVSRHGGEGFGFYGAREDGFDGGGVAGVEAGFSPRCKRWTLAVARQAATFQQRW